MFRAPPQGSGCGRCALFGLAALALSGMLLSPGCASGDDERHVTTESLVIPRKKPGLPPARAPERAAQVSREEAIEILGRAERLRRAEDYDKALSVLKALGRKRLPVELIDEVQRLRMEVKRHLLQSVYVDDLVILDSDRVTLGEPISGELVLINLARERLVIPASASLAVAGPPGAGVSPSQRLGEAAGPSETSILEDLSYEEFAADGTVITQRRTRSFRTGEDVVLEPGERRSWPLTVDSAMYNASSVGLREFTFTARLYPADILIGDEAFSGTLVFRPRVCRVFPRNWQQLRDDPVASLRKAILKRSPPHIPLAAALVPDERRIEALDLLTTTLTGRGGATPSGSVRVACCVALRVLTGWDLPADPEVWVDRLTGAARSGTSRR